MSLTGLSRPGIEPQSAIYHMRSERSISTNPNAEVNVVEKIFKKKLFTLWSTYMDMALRKNPDPYNIYNWLDPSMVIITIVIAFLNHARNRDEDFF